MPGQARDSRPARRAGGRPRLRSSDAERDRVLGELRERYAEGRLSHDTFLHRVDAVLRSKHQADLDSQLADLPRRPTLAETFRAAAWRLRQAIAAEDRLRSWPAALRLPAPEQTRCIIGREPACDLILADLTVSRWHAVLERGLSSWLLSDLGSTNGTRLNGWRVTTPVRVQPGDRVSFGEMTFVLTDRPAQAAGGGSRIRSRSAPPAPASP